MEREIENCHRRGEPSGRAVETPRETPRFYPEERCRIRLREVEESKRDAEMSI